MSASENCKKAFVAISELIAEKCGIDVDSEECRRATQASLEEIQERCGLTLPEILKGVTDPKVDEYIQVRKDIIKASDVGDWKKVSDLRKKLQEVESELMEISYVDTTLRREP